jgi:hypothetical protein
VGFGDIADQLPLQELLGVGTQGVPTEPSWPCQSIGFFEAFLKHELLRRRYARR